VILETVPQARIYQAWRKQVCDDTGVPYCICL